MAGGAVQETTKSTFVLEVEDTAEENGSSIFRSKSQNVDFHRISQGQEGQEGQVMRTARKIFDLEVRTAIRPLAHDAESSCWAELLHVTSVSLSSRGSRAPH